MNQGIKFTIETWHGKETCYMNIDTEKSIEKQVCTTLENIGYCENYQLITTEIVEPGYIGKRNSLLETLENFDPTWIEENSVLVAIGTIEELENELNYLMEGK